jgi:2-methylcitrate dehydratase PrpD
LVNAVSLCDDSRAMSETQTLAEYVVNADASSIPEDVQHEARRSVLNYVGCAIGGSHHTAVDRAILALGPYSGAPTARILARKEKLDPLHTALMNGISSHVFDYDDTTPQNYIHPTSPLASALFAYASVNPVHGKDFMQAFVLGFEVESRIGNAVYPAHYDVGWHITGTAGVFAAAAAIGKLLRLTVQEMIWSLGLAATQAAGLREMFGSMAKAFHPGRAAQNGYASALLAQVGFTSGEYGIEGPRGFAAVQSAKYDLSKIGAQLGTDFNLRRNTYKPFPCGIVNHPTIDGCIQLHDEHRVDPAKIKSVALRVAPLVMDLCGKKSITRGLEGKFSVVHGAAIGLVRGKGGIQEYTDEAVNDPAIRRVRETVSATGDPTITEDQAHIEVTLTDGRKLTKFVEKSLGNIHRPMSDKQLEEKFRDQSLPVLSGGQIDNAIDLCWKIESLDHVSSLVEATVPA